MFLMFICFIISFIFMQMKHPLAMGLMLLIQTCLISIFMGTLMKTFWFSYILFLIFMGGMLVLFIYVTSLSSNEMFSMSFKLLILFMTFFFIIFILMIFMDSMFMELFNMNNEMDSFSKMNMFLFEDTLSLNKMYNFPTNLITLLLINYLFLTLLVTVKITKKNYGPLRPMT
uniref:NADH-ubiquinone oxidoreductase chain 6 n=1 Tax=Tripteroides tasmaniensis TaxID=1806187 RepID=A0A7T0CPI5_9DIPT|nr:NADH dehydrogenase subunit 6 [Tripteroides tasmaniensis]QPJ78614.1 NADH dehydrogenase subunit 6 [Tripteroides tasmaniensis]